MKYTIDGQIPNFTINNFTTMSSTCLITKYTLYEEKDSIDFHPDFQPEGVINSDEGTITFSLNQEKDGEFSFYIKVEAEGGEYIWTTFNSTFIVQCGPLSAEVIEVVFWETLLYEIDGEVPHFSIP